jgi:hypothetical protein
LEESLVVSGAEDAVLDGVDDGGVDCAALDDLATVVVNTELVGDAGFSLDAEDVFEVKAAVDA